MHIQIYAQIINEFTAPQALGYFRKELEKYLQTPYQTLLREAPLFYAKLERWHEHAYEMQVTRFNHRTETRYLVLQYAYAGAMEMNKPISPCSVEEACVQFINAYNGMKRQRTESSSEVECFPLEDEKLHAVIDKAEGSMANPERIYDRHLGEEYMNFLDSLEPHEVAMVEALLNNTDGLSHRELARRLGMDPAVFCRRLKRIRQKLQSHL